MGDDIDLLWALISGVMLLVMAAGIGAIIEGFSRRRTVSTGAGRHVATAIGAAVGAVISTRFTSGSIEIGSDDPGLWVAVTTSVLIATIVSGAVVERATFLAHTAVGLAVGGVLWPGVDWAQGTDGVLGSISIDSEPFIDAASASVFAIAGWMALVGIMVIGPRRGRLSADGRVRIVPGKSMPAAAIGTLLLLATVVGLATRPSTDWNDELLTVASLIYLAAAAGGVVALLIGWQQIGAASTASLIHGSIAGAIATLGAPLDLTTLSAPILGAIAGALAIVANGLLGRAKVDDPVGVVGAFGVAGIWGTVAAKGLSVAAIGAQVVGSLILAAWAVMCAGVLFGVLRIVGVLRVSPDVEIVGLEA